MLAYTLYNLICFPLPTPTLVDFISILDNISLSTPAFSPISAPGSTYFVTASTPIPIHVYNLFF